MRLIILFTILFPLTSLAKDKGGDSKFSFASLTRVSFGYGWSEIQKSENTRVTQFQKPTTYWQEIDFLYPFGLRLGLRETFEQNANVQFGSGTKRGELYMTAIDFGARLSLVLASFQPYFAFGYVGGFLSVSDPSDRSNHNYLAAFDKAQPIRGVFGSFGFDWVLSNGVGIRLSYHAEEIDTDKFAHLGDTHMHFQHSRISLGVSSWLR